MRLSVELLSQQLSPLKFNRVSSINFFSSSDLVGERRQDDVDLLAIARHASNILCSTWCSDASVVLKCSCEQSTEKCAVQQCLSSSLDRACIGLSELSLVVAAFPISCLEVEDSTRLWSWICCWSLHCCGHAVQHIQFATDCLIQPCPVSTVAEH